MSKNVQVLDASPEAVWAVIADGSTYAEWVVGAAKIREVEAGWPAVGTKIHHTVGVLPVHINDVTEVVECKEREYLRLRARVRPIGNARISFELAPRDGGTEVTMIEVVDQGFASRFYGLLMRSAINARNTETLHRLEDLVQKRAGT